MAAISSQQNWRMFTSTVLQFVCGNYTASILLGLSGALTFYIVYQRFFSHLASVPGPFWASVSRFWLARKFFAGDWDKTLRKLHQRYGPLVRIAPDEVSVGDPEAIKTIYTSKGSWQKTDFYTNFAPHPHPSPNGDIFTLRNVKQHGRRRRQVNALYSMTSVAQAEPWIDTCINLLFEGLDVAVKNNETIDFAEYMQMYTFDVIGELFYGQPFGFLKGRCDFDNYIKKLDTVIPYTTTLGAMAWLRPLVPLLLLLSPGLATGMSELNEIIRVSKMHVDRRKASPNQRADILGKMFQIEGNGTNPDFTMEDIYMESFTAIVAGNDTTAIVLRTIFFYLARHPEYYRRLEEEIDKAYADGELSAMPRYAECAKLPYLTAVCRESMRIFPSVGYGLPRHVPKGGSVVCNHHFKAGVRLGINAHVIHFDRSIFGEDADEFKPQRWLVDEAKVNHMNKYMFQFGAGSRSCVGKNVSLQEIWKVVTALVRRYRIHIIDADKEWRTADYWFCKQFDIFATIEKRIHETGR
ncbi:hypothetical protein MRS44_011974 [Fusarium solani]|uniref:Cytochrome P450 n=1 Tax=Fusarium solani TaxID=169388 RepID=A0A9P9G0M3_FUSSL|nr:cytochrome P450 [Fusarium solani]KAH7230341.1 cytochrome P450 [Fusarium solani]KAJ3461107.1 hypothetical protein MRS44_011974 [Fusarium solani]